MSKRLYRSKTDKVLAGVCGGIAAYFNIDPVAVRAAFVLAVAFFGLSIWIYPILWVIIPEEGGKSKLQEMIEDAEIVEKKKDEK
jgi:phage shock protein PspC (stress-responsive transcriptional regulator)